MQGHIIKRGNKYSFVIDIGRDPITKKRKQKRVSGFTSGKKARKAMIDKIAEINKGNYVEPVNETLEKYLTDWLNGKEKRVSYGTYLHYKSYINKHIIPAIGHIKIADLKPRQIQDFYDALLGQEVLSNRSIHHIHRILSNALESGAKIGDIQRNIAKAVDPASVPKHEMKYWSMEVVHGFLENTQKESHFISFYIALFTGMRQGEILGLKWDCVDLENKAIYVHRSLKRKKGKYEIADLKNNSSYRSISISDTDAFELKKHFNQQKEHKLKVGEDYDNQNLVIATAFGNHVLPSNLWRAFSRSIKQIKVEPIRFHDLRHTHASMLFRLLKVHPKIVQERLGHSSIQVTLDTYSHMLPNMQDSLASGLESAFKKEKEKQEHKFGS